MLSRFCDVCFFVGRDRAPPDIDKNKDARKKGSTPPSPILPPRNLLCRRWRLSQSEMSAGRFSKPPIAHDALKIVMRGEEKEVKVAS
jgi:hypothetical protein